MDSGLEGKTALVTGASGGIGWAIALGLAAEGCRLALHARSGGDALRRRVQAAGLEDRALVVEADVRDPLEVEEMFQRTGERFGDTQVCVACAGIWPEEFQRIDRLEPARAGEVLTTNLFGALWTARSFLRQTAARGTTGTSLVLVGSTAGRFGEAGHADYAISKSGLHGLMLSYKNEVVLVDPEGRCNLVEPGWTSTPMTELALDDDEVVRSATQTMPLRRIASVADIASAVVYFASPRLAAHLSGQSLTVAGGMEGRVLWQREQIDPDLVRRRLREQV